MSGLALGGWGDLFRRLLFHRVDGDRAVVWLPLADRVLFGAFAVKKKLFSKRDFAVKRFYRSFSMRAVIKTWSGKWIDLLEPVAMAGAIDIDDIGHSLANTNRFNGHTSRPYSVAEHCLRGVEYSLPGHRLEFLLHDATEAYLGDTVGPLKSSERFSPYRELSAGPGRSRRGSGCWCRRRRRSTSPTSACSRPSCAT